MIIFVTLLTLPLLALTFTPIENFESCGAPSGCFCHSPINSDIFCTSEVTVFPIFDHYMTPGILTITFNASQIVDLNPFPREYWDRLHTVHFIDMPQIPCETLSTLHNSGLRVVTTWSSVPPSCDSNCRSSIPTPDCETVIVSDSRTVVTMLIIVTCMSACLLILNSTRAGELVRSIYVPFTS